MNIVFNSKLLLEELSLFFKQTNLNSFISCYKRKGWNILIDIDSIVIKTEKNTYHLGVVERCDKYFWCLLSYEKVHFLKDFILKKNFLNNIIYIIENIEKN